jgi:hypothetical protein
MQFNKLIGYGVGATQCGRPPKGVHIGAPLQYPNLIFNRRRVSSK